MGTLTDTSGGGQLTPAGVDHVIAVLEATDRQFQIIARGRGRSSPAATTVSKQLAGLAAGKPVVVKGSLIYAGLWEGGNPKAATEFLALHPDDALFTLNPDGRFEETP